MIHDGDAAVNGHFTADLEQGTFGGIGQVAVKSQPACTLGDRGGFADFQCGIGFHHDGALSRRGYTAVYSAAFAQVQGAGQGDSIIVAHIVCGGIFTARAYIQHIMAVVSPIGCGAIDVIAAIVDACCIACTHIFQEVAFYYLIALGAGLDGKSVFFSCLHLVACISGGVVAFGQQGNVLFFHNSRGVDGGGIENIKSVSIGCFGKSLIQTGIQTEVFFTVYIHRGVVADGVERGVAEFLQFQSAVCFIGAQIPGGAFQGKFVFLDVLPALKGNNIHICGGMGIVVP